ncbi:pilus assembly protein TadG-related protein [Planctomicrobium sp. SH527]|uniref:pilus assembly protein TadG-related protein n=1 Tax=Planctomicrobium sp. SH527 TaxID=3448123 RepID=UPI003F5BF83E
MKIIRTLTTSADSGVSLREDRRGSVLVLTCLCLVGLLAAAAISVDVGYIQIQKTRMQNAVDAAALAAAQEISHAIRKAPIGEADPVAYARGNARLVASRVAELSGIYVDPQQDVMFGQRQFNQATGKWTTNWNASITNAVKVVARRTKDDPGAQDGRLKLFFGGVLGKGYTDVKTEAMAFVKSRDIVVIHDFSRSMNFDSHFPLNNETSSRLSDAQVVSNIRKLWDDLNPSGIGTLNFSPQHLTASATSSGVTATCKFRYMSCDVTTTTSLRKVVLTYTNGSTATSNYTGSQKTASITGTRDISSVAITSLTTNGRSTVSQTLSDNATAMISCFNLGTFPYSGGSWTGYFNHCHNDEQMIEKGYRETYGGISFVNYVMRSLSAHSQTPKIAQSRHYPFTSIKVGHELLCNFLDNLSFNDRLGMVSYDTNHRVENYQNSNNAEVPKVDVRDEPISSDFTAMNNLMKYKQANHYSASTNMGGGLKTGIQLLKANARKGSQPTILLMTDGNSNTIDSGESSTLPNGWNWNTLFDFNEDGTADYQTNDSQKRYVLKQAYEAVQAGYIVNTMAVGMDADRDLLQAIAWMGNGVFINVPGGSSTEEMEQQILEAFQRIASMVPPGQLVNTIE